MKKLKGFIIVIAGLFIMITLVSLLLPSRVMTLRSIVIKGDRGYIFSEIGDLKKWKDWHPVFMNDSSKINISDNSSGINAIATWMSNDKENKFVVTEESGDHVRLSLMRKGQNAVDNIISINAMSDSNTVQVEWRAFTKLKWYPWEKFSGIFLEKITGPGYELALNNLKKLAENKTP